LQETKAACVAVFGLTTLAYHNQLIATTDCLAMRQVEQQAATCQTFSLTLLA
jgi:hypothetical protein